MSAHAEATEPLVETAAAGWSFDLACGHRAMTTTGGSTWAAAYLLADFLESAWPELGLGTGSSALELGSGTGWLGIALARNRPELGEVMLTEQADGGAMQWLDDNVSEQRRGGAALANLRTHELDWLHWDGTADNAEQEVGTLQHERYSEVVGRRWDVLLGSDLVYNEIGVRLLPRVVRALLQGSAEPSLGMFYAHTLHRFDSFDLDFFQELRAQGLLYRLVAWDSAQSEAPPSDPLEQGGFLEELFPEQRLGIFQIVLPANADGLLLPRPVHAAAAEAVAAFEAARSGEAGKAQLRDEEEDDGNEHEEEATSEDQNAGRVRLREGLCLVLPDGVPLPPEDLRPGEMVLSLPALGPFGSGSHPTTRLILDFLVSREGRDRLAAAGAVCDFGCGSGVLGLGALALGARRAVGVDLDPAALAAAAANALANGATAPTAPAHRLRQAAELAEGRAARPAPCGGRELELHLPPGEFLQKDLDFFCRFGDWREAQATDGWVPLPPGGSFDLVLANIVVGPLCHVASAVAALLPAGGEVLLSGFRKGQQARQVEAAYGAQGLQLEALGSLRGWALLRAVRR